MQQEIESLRAQLVNAQSGPPAATEPLKLGKGTPYVLAIWQPRLAQKWGAFAVQGDVMFYYAVATNKHSIAGGQTELATPVLLSRRDINFIDVPAWRGVQEHGRNAEAIAAYRQSGALRLHLPDNGDTRTTADFKNDMAAIEIVNAASNPDWLRITQSQDRRTSIDTAVRRRLQELDALREQQSRQQPGMQQFFAGGTNSFT